MSLLTLEGLSFTIVNLLVNIVLVLGIYLIFMFIKKLIRQGRFEMNLWEIFLGVILVALALYLKFFIFFE